MMTVIDATLLGDSHAMVIDAAAAHSERTFQHRFLEPFATYIGAKLVRNNSGQVDWVFGDAVKDFGDKAAERLRRKNEKAGSLSRRMEKVVASGLPVYSTLGVTAFAFVRSMAAAARKNREDVSLIQAKIARAAAARHFDDYAEFYQSLRDLGLSVTCTFPPTRFTPETRKIWMAYDQVVAERLELMGIDMIDMRADVGGEDLLLNPIYNAEDPEDTVHANELWGSKMLEGILKHAKENVRAAAI